MKQSVEVGPGLYSLHFDLDDSDRIYVTELTHDPTSDNFVRIHDRGHFEGKNWDDVRFVPKQY